MNKNEQAERIPPSAINRESLDVVIIGAGFSGMYALHRLRQLGLSIRLYETAADVGGTWWWNRYPGARVDSPGGPFYCYTFSEELVREWDWPETQPDQPTVLAYLNYVADKFDLRRDMRLGAGVDTAVFDEGTGRWSIDTATGESLSARFVVSAMGTLTAPLLPSIPGIEDFKGEIHHTGLWPHEPVSFAGKRIGVIGTGSSGVQVIPALAQDAAHVTVFQRTPQYTIPARNRPVDPQIVADSRADWPALREEMKGARKGFVVPPPTRSALDDTPEQRAQVYEEAWQRGGMAITNTYTDLLTDEEANRTISEFLRAKIRDVVDDPEVARKLTPEFPFGTKRVILDTGYFETYNRSNVELVDLREEPIQKMTADGVETKSGRYDLDALVLATGYDALTGALTRLNPIGRGGVSLRERWSHQISTYLGLHVAGFPNFFIIHGPLTPSVMFNMPLGAELQSDWIADLIQFMRTQGLATAEATPQAEAEWKALIDELADATLFRRTPSWYTGGNVPGKPYQFLVHLGGPKYYEALATVTQPEYDGLELAPEPATVSNDVDAYS